jgi:hypothetical protein
MSARDRPAADEGTPPAVSPAYLLPSGGPMNRYALLFAAVVSISACADSPVAPSALPDAASLAITTGSPDDLPNVFRVSQRFAIGIQDPENGLRAFAGLPDDPRTYLACGGEGNFAVVDVQHTGALRDVLQALAKTNSINLHVYEWTPTINLCTAQWIARGVGRFTYVDNDRFASGTRSNTWGYHFGGPVTFADGSTASLVAHNRFIFDVDEGPTRLVYRHVSLSGN